MPAETQAACSGISFLTNSKDVAHPGAVRFGGQGSLAQTIRPRKIAGVNPPPDLDLPEGEPVSPPNHSGSNSDEEGLSGSEEDPREGLHHNATAGTDSFPSGTGI